MQELEKILEEIEDLQDISGWDLQTVQGVLDIIRKHMNGGWILVNERLPEVGEYVLGSNKYSEVLIFRYGWNSPHTKKMFFHMCGAAASGITAWMPLPDPYRTEDCCGEYKQDWKAGFMQRFERKI